MKWPLIGNAHITDYLTKSIEHGDINSAYIFAGPEDLGKTTTAYYFAQMLLCEQQSKGEGALPCCVCRSCLSLKKEGREEKTIVHGDLHILRKAADKKTISVEAVREFIRMLSMSSFLGNYKIGIIKDAESLSSEAANALLKTLEEPRDNVVIILVAETADRLPLTIQSRSQTLIFRPVASDLIYEHLLAAYKAKRSAAKHLSRMCLGRPALAVKMFEDREFLAEQEKQADDFMAYCLENLNERLIGVSELLGKLGGQEAVERAKLAIDTWRGVLRDRLLWEYNLPDRLRYDNLAEKQRTLSARLPIDSTLKLLNMMERSRVYLEANVSPRLVLEQIVINI